MIRQQVIVVYMFSGKRFRISDINSVEMRVDIFLETMNLFAEKYLNTFISLILYKHRLIQIRRISAFLQISYVRYTCYKDLCRGYLMYFEGEKMLELKVRVTQNNLGIFYS
jgi:hypothetical protein